MKAKKWLMGFCGLVGFVMVAVGGVNYVVDPMWNFTHANIFNKKQDGFDERQQKTNFAKVTKMDIFDGIILGSSRTTFLNQNDFENFKYFNYSSSSMRPIEYKGYINIAKKLKNRELEHVIIGVDFFGSGEPRDVKFEMPDFYINKANAIVEKYKTLLSLSLLKQTFKSLKYSILGTKTAYYDRGIVKHQDKVSESERRSRYETNLKRHSLEFTNEKYKYDTTFLKSMKNLKVENKKTKFIIFTTPITADLVASINNNMKRTEDYQRWLSELIEVFGEIYHFQTINSVTTNLENYPDDDHAYPHVMKLVAQRIEDKLDEVPSDFGMILNKDNFEGYMVEFKKQLKNYDISNINKIVFD